MSQANLSVPHCVEAFLDDKPTDFIKEIRDGLVVLVGRSLHLTLAVRDVLHLLDSEALGHGPVIRQVTLAAHQDCEQAVCHRLQVVCPHVKLIERVLIVNRVNKDANISALKEEVG